MAFIFGGFLGQNVTFESLTAFDGTTWTDAEAFFRRALGLHFGHLHAPFYIVLVRRLQSICSLDGPEPLGVMGFTPSLFDVMSLTTSHPRQSGKPLSQPTITDLFLRPMPNGIGQ
jgi:hypothetical protein